MLIKDYIFSGRYDVAAEMCAKYSKEKLKDEILNITYETENISIYAFSQYMLQNSNEKIWIEIIIDIMMNPLCFINGAYSVALFYAREAIKYEKTIANFERILFFYNLPERLICEEEAKLLARAILQIDSNNVVALAIK